MPLSAYSAAYTSDVGFTVTAKGKFAFQWGSATSSGNIAVLDKAGRALRPVTGLNEELLASRAIGALEEIDYVSSAGDLPIQGWVIYPPGFDPRKKYPLVLEIHGGPNANYGPRFDIEKQLLAAAGYVVLYVNARGSTSYGGDFGNLIQDKFPGLEFEDFMSGVDAMLARGFIDENRLYVAGGSGGGTLSAQIVSKTDRFQAAAVLYPVLDWTVQALTADTMSLVFDGLFHDTPWSHPEAYQRRSLLATVPDVKTPVMTLTGENDYRTPMVQSEMYHAALKYNGVESVLVRMPMEGHGTRRYPSHFAAKVGAIIGWFDAHNPAVTGPEEAPD
jgi:acylaminoacyl-peptidase